MGQATRIFTDVDYDKDGKQTGWLYLPYSVTRSAYGNIAIPVVVVKNGSGPSVLLMAGNHGDEYEGQVGLCKAIRSLEPGEIRGRVIAVPAINLPAALAGARVSPLDGVNFNRAFPGDANGTPTYAIAHYVDSVLFPMVSFFLDLHSGGPRSTTFPSCRCGRAVTRASMPAPWRHSRRLARRWAWSGRIPSTPASHRRRRCATDW